MQRVNRLNIEFGNLFSLESLKALKSAIVFTLNHVACLMKLQIQQNFSDYCKYLAIT